MLNNVKHLVRIVRISNLGGVSEMLHLVQHDVLFQAFSALPRLPDAAVGEGGEAQEGIVGRDEAVGVFAVA
jgi:hypothetical protein